MASALVQSRVATQDRAGIGRGKENIINRSQLRRAALSLNVFLAPRRQRPCCAWQRTRVAATSMSSTCITIAQTQKKRWGKAVPSPARVERAGQSERLMVICACAKTWRSGPQAHFGPVWPGIVYQDDAQAVRRRLCDAADAIVKAIGVLLGQSQMYLGFISDFARAILTIQTRFEVRSWVLVGLVQLPNRAIGLARCGGI